MVLGDVADLISCVLSSFLNSWNKTTQLLLTLIVNVQVWLSKNKQHEKSKAPTWAHVKSRTRAIKGWLKTHALPGHDWANSNKVHSKLICFILTLIVQNLLFWVWFSSWFTFIVWFVLIILLWLSLLCHPFQVIFIIFRQRSSLILVMHKNPQKVLQGLEVCWLMPSISILVLPLVQCGFNIYLCNFITHLTGKLDIEVEAWGGPPPYLSTNNFKMKSCMVSIKQTG